MRLPPVHLSESEFLAYSAVCDLGTASVEEVRDYLEEHHYKDLAYKTVATFVTRVLEKGWLRIVEAPPPVGKGRPQLLFAPAVPFEQALVHHFHRFLDNFGLNRPEALTILRRALKAK